MNKGLMNERLVINALHGQRLRDLPDHFRIPIRKMFNISSEDDFVYAKKVSNFVGCKTDFELYMYRYYLNISVKSGRCPSLHQEEFSSFITFLESLNISKRTINILKFFHYGDGSKDGTGVKTLRFDVFKEKYAKYFKEASEELSQDHIVRAIVYRAIIKGRIEKRQEINYLYYGTAEDGFFLHKSDILKYASQTGYEKYTAIHFGPIVYVAKMPSRRAKDGTKVHYAQLVWPDIKIDLLRIKKMAEDDGYTYEIRRRT